MLPRTELVAIAAETAGDAMIDQVANAGYPTLPVYRDNLDNVVGILHVVDVIRAITAGDRNQSAASLAREALTVPETISADDLLVELRRKRAREAIVIDEYGGTAGLVTFEWLMDRIVGDVGGSAGNVGGIVVRPDGSAEIDGLTLVTDVNEQFDLSIDEETYTTVGGYVMGRLGRAPRTGDAIEVAGRQMKVITLDGMRVARVWLSTSARQNAVEPANRAEPGA
jgi:CBS domain containing-hemolysin-like protein